MVTATEVQRWRYAGIAKVARRWRNDDDEGAQWWRYDGSVMETKAQRWHSDGTIMAARYATVALRWNCKGGVMTAQWRRRHEHNNGALMALKVEQWRWRHDDGAMVTMTEAQQWRNDDAMTMAREVQRWRFDGIEGVVTTAS
ncbi:hypothetical protein U1Q18_031583 [Sarracenia purpurea var. burkii]